MFNTNSEDIFLIGDYKIYIPFLNGGLFRLDDSELNLNISLEKNEWENIFEFLNSYYWIIEDVKATEADEEKILTPQILGHVYERSVVEWEMKGFESVAAEVVETGNERKKKGVYYTPESITDYISNKTIIPYLLSKLDIKYDSFEQLIAYNDPKSFKDALDILNDIKILDPACGSGAFLIKASEVLFMLKRRLYYKLNSDKNEFYDIKLGIITENIYGVDILSGAVEISKLRLWLWLIAHYQNDQIVEPLPNIEYNIMCGNSLLGFVESKAKITKRRKELNEKTLRFEELKKEYKTSYGKSSNLIRELLEKEMDSERSDTTEHFMHELIIKGIDILKIKKDTQYNFYGEESSSEKIDYIYKEEFESDYKPFHWNLEFSEVFREPKLGFDIIVGNPPYGNLLSDEEKKIMDFYQTIKNNEIAANFVERSIELLNPNSYFGQIIANNIAINKNTSSCRTLIRKNFAKTEMALFGTRPAKIFQDAEIRVMIMISHKSNDLSGNIYTTDAIKLTQETKENFTESIKFKNTEGLELGKRSIGDGLEDVALPKIGYCEIKEILNKLKNKSDRTFEDLVNKGEYKLDFRKTGGYWLNALENFPYNSTKIVEISFPTEIERDYAIILVNSSLFYLYWSSYGNLRDLPPALFYKFPCPDKSELKEFATEIHALKQKLESCLLTNFLPDVGQVGEFRTAKCKSLIDESDNLISRFYGLDEDLLEFVIKYDKNIRPNEQ